MRKSHTYIYTNGKINKVSKLYPTWAYYMQLAYTLPSFCALVNDCSNNFPFDLLLFSTVFGMYVGGMRIQLVLICFSFDESGCSPRTLKHKRLREVVRWNIDGRENLLTELRASLNLKITASPTQRASLTQYLPIELHH